jgi:hypothetical protein
MSATSITAVGSSATSTTDVTTNACPDSAAVGVTPSTCLVSLACITSCTSIEDYRSQRPPCFNCGCVMHYAQQCHGPRRGKAQRDPTSTVIQSRGQLRAPTPRSSRVNHTTIEDIPEGEEVLARTFLLFGHPIIIPLDSRASNGFMSLACAKKAELSL